MGDPKWSFESVPKQDLVQEGRIQAALGIGFAYWLA